MNNIFLILASVTLNALAQLLIRKGMLSIGNVDIDNFAQHIGAMATNMMLWGAMLCYALSILLWMSVLSKVEVSFAYPFLSIGYVIGAIVGYYAFGEDLSITRILGILIICFGVYIISRS